MSNVEIANLLVNALDDLAKARQSVALAMAALAGDAPPIPARHTVAVRTTSTQVMAVLASASDPLTLIDIADGVCAIRRGEDTPRKNGGTRYQEMCRTALSRLIDRGQVRRIEPTSRTALMRFCLV